MNFLYPMGLWGLIGVPILIIIYIIKSKYTERTVTSTFLWTLSEKFLKKRRPIDRVTGIISLILQILAVVLISLALAHPIIVLPDAASEYCFIVDASGSMNMADEGEKTRFEVAKDEVARRIDEAENGSVFSLITVGDSTQVVFEKTSSKKQALELLDEIEVSYSKEQYTDALMTAQRYFDENPGILTYLVTDKKYDDVKNIEVVNIAKPQNNYSVSNVTYKHLGGVLTVTGSVTSYDKDGSVKLQLFLDGNENPSQTGTAVVKKGVPTTFQLACNVDSFKYIRVAVDKTDILSMDNETYIYNVESEQIYKTLIVSETPFFFKSALSAITNAQIDVVDPADYVADTSGYGLYIFDSFDPPTLPDDGTVWLVNPQGSVDGSGFSVQGHIKFEEGAQQLELSSSSSSATQKLINGIPGNEIYIAQYAKCGLYRNFTSLFEYQSNPILFAGTNTHGNREVVFAFNLHDSNLPVLVDFIVIMRNLLEYSFPDIIEDVSYYVGEEMNVNIIANCERITVKAPSGEISYLESESGVGKYTLREVGTHEITMVISGTSRVFKVYSELPIEERQPEAVANEISLQGEAEPGGIDGEYDPLLVILICLVVIFVADWMVYCYEKYQLR